MTTTDVIIRIIQDIPMGKVLSYSGVARLAGVPNGARLVVRVLHTSSGKHRLPWWRVLRADGSIAMEEGSGGDEQRERLLAEGVTFLSGSKVDMLRCQWQGD